MCACSLEGGGEEGKKRNPGTKAVQGPVRLAPLGMAVGLIPLLSPSTILGVGVS